MSFFKRIERTLLHVFENNTKDPHRNNNTKPAFLQAEPSISAPTNQSISLHI